MARAMFSDGLRVSFSHDTSARFLKFLKNLQFLNFSAR
jgi:hypothetical protein